MKQTTLIKQQNSKFFKIKNFIINLFRQKEKEIKKEEFNYNNENDFKQRIIIKENKERARLLNLQQEFVKGNILEEEISEENVQKLHKLYDEQIEEIDKQTEIYKKRILEIKAKLNKSAN